MLKTFKIILPVVALAFIAKLLFDYWPEIAATSWSFSYWQLFASLVVLVALFFLDALGWWLILAAGGDRIPVSAAIAVWLRSSLSRYIPGVLWAYAGRAVLAKEHGVAGKACLRSMLIENIMLVLGSFTIGMPAIAVQLTANVKVIAVIYLLFVIATLCLLSSTGLRILAKLSLVNRYTEAIGLPSVKPLWPVYLFYCAFWAIFAVVFIVFLIGLDVHFASVSTALLAGCAFSASFCIGFVLVVFPGGLGIREVTLFGLLSGLVGPASGIVISASSRFWLIAGELGALTIFAVWAGCRARQQPGS